jgi:hypothetical protein
MLFCFYLLFSINFAYADGKSLFERGEHLFRTAGGYGCSICHGMFAQGGGNVGGDVRGKGIDKINIALEKEPTMQLLSSALDLEQRNLLASYLIELGKMPSVEWIIDDKVTFRSVPIKKGTLSQLVLVNKRLETIRLALPFIAESSFIEIKPYETKAVQWTPEEGTIELVYKQSVLDIQIK